MKFFELEGKRYPEYLRKGNGSSYIQPFAEKFCQGKGLDIGAGKFPFPGAMGIDPNRGPDREYGAMNIPTGPWDYIFSSHCLEHLEQPIDALRLWNSAIKPGGCLFIYLPHPDNADWQPRNNKGHIRIWTPADTVEAVKIAGFTGVINSERDLLWSFAVVGFKA